jgi:RHS repeat-associated protein
LPDGSVMGFAYDAAGHLTSLTPPGRPNHLFSYTPADLVSTYTPPAVLSGGVTRYNYNRDRQLTMIARPDGKTVSFAYDPAGRLDALTMSRGSYGFSYNTAGQISKMIDPDGGEVENAYSGPLLMSTTWKGPVIGSVSFAYDNDFRLTSETAAGSSVAYSYDADGLLIDAGPLSLSRDAQNGLLTGSTLGVISDTWTYNSFGEPVSYSAASLFAQQYGRDDGGRITQKFETVMGETHKYLYGYDTAGRLSGVTRDGANVSSYTYDSNGNRLPGTYDSQDRMLAYGGATYMYTGNGELASKTDGSGATTYDYDELGTLTKVSLPTGKVIEYVIDGQSRRVGKKIAGILVRQWLYGDALRIVAELDGTGAVTSRFVYGSRANVPDYMIRGGITYRIISDHLGSPRVIADSANSSVVQFMDFDEFGNVLLDTNPGFTPFGFAGGLYDGDTNLVRFGARDYDARVGRWAAKDPALFAGSGSNLYGYSFADPINFLDVDGHHPIAVAVGAAAAAGALTGAGGVLTVEMLNSLRNNRGLFGCVNGRDVAVGAGVGFAAGAAAPFVAETLLGAMTLGATANVAQYTLTNLANGRLDETTFEGVWHAAALGTIGGLIAGKFARGARIFSETFASKDAAAAALNAAADAAAQFARGNFSRAFFGAAVGNVPGHTACGCH